MFQTRKSGNVSPLLISALSVTILAGCNSREAEVPNVSQPEPVVQRDIDARVVSLLTVDGLQFKDLNKSGKLDAYEDWRRPVEERVENLLGQMTLEEKVGMMLIDTLNAGVGGELYDQALQYIRDEKMTRFIFRNDIAENPVNTSISPWSGAQVTITEAAEFLNSTQETAEATRLGIPLLFKSNPRNHVDPDPKFGISAAAGVFSAWPKGQGLAATRDMELIGEFAETVRAEWTAVGIRGMYGYTLDLATEPRWNRVHETFSEDADLVSDIARVLLEKLQGKELAAGGVALTMKHFPGGGPQERGGDPHYDFGKQQVYPADNFNYQLKPFKAAIAAGSAAIMPYYGIPVGQRYLPNDVGMAFSKGILTDLLRGELGFDGVVNSDTGIITERAWGLEDKSIAERLVIAIEAGTDVLSGFHSNKQILDLVTSGQLTEARIDASVRRLLTVQFRLGLFENPYVDPARAAEVVGNEEYQKKAGLAQRKSIVLLQNDEGLLPLKPTDEQNPKIKLYVMGLDDEVASDNAWNFEVDKGDFKPELGEKRPQVPADTDAAVIRVVVNNNGADKALRFGGANEDELDMLSFTDMAVAKSWNIQPSLEDIRAVMSEIGAEKTVLAIYFRQPYVLDEASGLRDAGAILATFGITDEALLDVISGQFYPSGKLPFALANNAEAIVRQAPDAPGYDKDDTLFPFDWGLSYEQ